MRVRAFARLHILHEFGVARVGHVENAHAGHVILGVLHATLATVVAIATAFGGKE